MTAIIKGSKIGELRKKMNLSQMEMANRLHLSRSTIAALETDRAVIGRALFMSVLNGEKDPSALQGQFKFVNREENQATTPAVARTRGRKPSLTAAGNRRISSVKTQKTRTNAKTNARTTTAITQSATPIRPGAERKLVQQIISATDALNPRQMKRVLEYCQLVLAAGPQQATSPSEKTRSAASKPRTVRSGRHGGQPEKLVAASRRSAKRQEDADGTSINDQMNSPSANPSQSAKPNQAAGRKVRATAATGKANPKANLAGTEKRPSRISAKRPKRGSMETRSDTASSQMDQGHQPNEAIGEHFPLPNDPINHQPMANG